MVKIKNIFQKMQTKHDDKVFASIADKDKTVSLPLSFPLLGSESGGTNFHRSADMDFMSL